MLVRCALAHYLQTVRETGAVDGFLQFFLRAVKAQSDDAVDRAGRLVELSERYHADSHLDRSRVQALIPLIFQAPFLTTARVSRALAVTPQGARNILERAAKHGWIREYPTGRGGRILWVAGDVLAVIEAPLGYGDDPQVGPTG
jgi:hypothetical protein